MKDEGKWQQKMPSHRDTKMANILDETKRIYKIDNELFCSELLTSENAAINDDVTVLQYHMKQQNAGSTRIYVGKS